jgi:aminopeptidase-like protein
MDVIGKLLATMQEHVSGHLARNHVAEIARYHRLQASPGYRQAAQYCQRCFEEFGIHAEVLGFPAREGTTCWGWPMFQEWEASEGVLRLIEPPEHRRKLADYNEARLSLIQRSAPFEGEAEVVLLEDGEEWAEYEGLDLRGKVVLTKGDRDRVHYLAVEKHGAVGIITDALKELPGLRHPMDLPDALQYTSFWWYGGETRCFGFVLSPKEGARLRLLIRERQRDGKPPVKVQVSVKSRFWDGEINTVSALIPGQTKEEVLLLAHLCHPQGAANDNASGSATVLEAARVLQSLISRGTLAQPRRGIRFLLVPEMLGFAAYLANNESLIPNMVAALNLDMVGEDQSLCGSTMTIEQAPGSFANYADDLVVRLAEETSSGATNYAGLEGQTASRHAVTPFSGGSDHCLLIDPSVGVPCPMINQWPDKFYHTSADTLDKVDPSMLARVGSVAATYAYFLADAGPEEAVWLAEEVLSRHKTRVLALTRDGLTRSRGADHSPEDGEMLSRRVRFLQQRAEKALQSILRLADVDVSAWQEEALAFAEAELARIAKLVPLSPAKPPAGAWEQEAASIVLRRLCPGPIDPKNFINRMSDEEHETWWRVYKERPEATYVYPALLLYWADGHRNVQEISDLIELEMGKRVTELLVTCCQLWQRLGLVELSTAS